MRKINYDRLIVECARRLTKKLGDGPYTMNGEFMPSVKVEIARMKKNCASATKENNSV